MNLSRTVDSLVSHTQWVAAKVEALVQEAVKVKDEGKVEQEAESIIAALTKAIATGKTAVADFKSGGLADDVAGAKVALEAIEELTGALKLAEPLLSLL